MRSGFTLVVVLAGWLVAFSTPAADYYHGLEAYEQGDYQAALREWVSLAEQGDAESQFRVARMYYRGEGVQDDAAAVRWYRMAAEQGHAVARNNLGLMYEEGRGLERDHAEAARWYRMAANQGVKTAQANLARLHDEGLGVSRDPTTAAHWYRRAANAGHPASQYRLARMYDEGVGVPRNPAKALKWYRKAADNGHDGARDALYSRQGTGSSQNTRRRRATEPGSGDAEVPDEPFATDDEEPTARADRAASERPGELRELRELAGQGDVEAQYRLARIYATGEGVPQDRVEAGRWMREAAEQGHEMAGYRIALMYLRARGVSDKKDFVQAYRWFGISADRGIGDAAEWRDKLAAKMSEEEIAEAERLRREGGQE